MEITILRNKLLIQEIGPGPLGESQILTTCAQISICTGRRVYRCRAVKSMFFFTLGCKPHNPNRVEKTLKKQMAFSCAIGATVWLKISWPERKTGCDVWEVPWVPIALYNPANEGCEPNAGSRPNRC